MVESVGLHRLWIGRFKGANVAGRTVATIGADEANSFESFWRRGGRRMILPDVKWIATLLGFEASDRAQFLIRALAWSNWHKPTRAVGQPCR
jgi:hypothetical protein